MSLEEVPLSPWSLRAWGVRRAFRLFTFEAFHLNLKLLRFEIEYFFRTKFFRGVKKVTDGRWETERKVRSGVAQKSSKMCPNASKIAT